MSDMPAIDHVGFQVNDFATAFAFYTAALKPLGWKKVMEFKGDGYQGAGFGPDGKPVLWISTGGRTAPRVHMAFTAKSRAAVDAFYKAALKAGGKDNGPPGVRKEYHPHYYAAFVLDPDGQNIEAVIHTPEPAMKKTAAKAGKKVAKTAKKAGKSAKKAVKSAAKTAGKTARKVAKKAKKAGKKKAKG